MNKKLLGSLVLLLLAYTGAYAQKGGYWLVTLNNTYTPLSSASSMNGTTMWDSSQHYSAPIGFSFMVDTSTTNIFNLFRENSFTVDTSTNPIIHGFLMLDATLADRGTGTSTSLSGLRYTTTGTAPNRIFKVEIANAGFAQEYALHGTLNDYINMQIWLYEGTNWVELHYGSSSISHPSDYFPISGGTPAMGYMMRKDMIGNGTLYMPAGIYPAGVSLDSIVFSSYNAIYVGQTFLSPLDGMVFRYTPVHLGVDHITVNNASIYPTACSNEVIVDFPGSELTTYNVIAVNGIATGIAGHLQGLQTHIDVSTLPAGVYMLQLQNSTGKAIQKIVKL